MKHYFILLSVLILFVIGGCSTPAQDRAKLKEEIKREIIAELALSQAEQTSPQITAKQEQLPSRERLSDSTYETATPVTAFGSAEGLILRNGNGFPACRVKLVRLAKSDSLLDLFSAYREGVEFETVTDTQGKYSFEKVPVGDYKIKWQLPRDKGWIRRLKDKPDVTITQSETSVLKPVETNGTLVPR